MVLGSYNFEADCYRVDLSKPFIKDSQSRLWVANQPIIDLNLDFKKGELIIFSENRMTFLNMFDQIADPINVSFEGSHHNMIEIFKLYFSNSLIYWNFKFTEVKTIQNVEDAIITAKSQ